MQGTRMCLALSDMDEMHKIKAFLTANGFNVVDESQDGASALRRIRSLRPDLVLVDYELSGLNGVDIAKIVEEDRICAAIVIKSLDQGGLWSSPGTRWEMAYLHRPITKSTLLQTIHLVMMNYRKISRLEEEIDELRTTLETRKAVERAKGILMQRLNISEQEAYRRLQKQSMDKGMSMKELAEAIITAYEIGG